jgi:hypothetical protein
MTEIYTNTSEFIYFDVINSTTDADPTATLIDESNVSTSLFVQQVHPASDGATETWSAYVPLEETTVEREVRVVWAGSVTAEAFSKTEYVSIVTPYITPESIARKYGFSFNEGDANYRSRDEVVEAERLARNTIDLLCGQSFGARSKTLAAYGKGSDVLYMGENVVSISKLYQNGELVIDGNDFTNFGYAVEPTETGTAIRIVDTDFYNIEEFESPKISPYGPYGQFRSGYRYNVQGVFGFANVPSRISDACGILANDYLCQDAIWRARYLNHVEMKDWKFNFEKDAFRGTGNLIADQLISGYAVTKFFVI